MRSTYGKITYAYRTYVIGKNNVYVSYVRSHLEFSYMWFLWSLLMRLISPPAYLMCGWFRVHSLFPFSLFFLSHFHLLFLPSHSHPVSLPIFSPLNPARRSGEAVWGQKIKIPCISWYKSQTRSLEDHVYLFCQCWYWYGHFRTMKLLLSDGNRTVITFYVFSRWPAFKRFPRSSEWRRLALSSTRSKKRRISTLAVSALSTNRAFYKDPPTVLTARYTMCMGGIAIVSRPSDCPSVHPPVCLWRWGTVAI